MVSEAACFALNEIATKLPIAVVESGGGLQRVIRALQTCLESESWPIRDAGSIALGSVFAAHPPPSTSSTTFSCVRVVRACMDGDEDGDGGGDGSGSGSGDITTTTTTTSTSTSTTTTESEVPGVLEVCLSLWLKHCGDHIWSVRANAAAALGQLLGCADTAVVAAVLVAVTAHLNIRLIASKDEGGDGGGEGRASRRGKGKVCFMTPAQEHALSVLSKSHTVTAAVSVTASTSASQQQQQQQQQQVSTAEREAAEGALSRRRGAWGCCLDCQVTPTCTLCHSHTHAHTHI
jgi:hypothetical protein